tara:strand:- start:310 stop:765 length:456 start_codon:yes stop_codon:yes gene_type:complete
VRPSKLFFLFFVSLLTFSCEKETDSTDEDLWGHEGEKWKEKSITNYDYTLQINCFCIREYTLPKRIEVRDNQVVSIEGLPFESLNDPSYRTIDEFFDYIQTQRALNPVVETIEYDKEYSFPSYIYFDISEMIADEEIGYTLTDFKPQTNTP